LRRALTECDQAALGQDVEHAPHGVVAVCVELLERHAPADGDTADLVAGQPQQDAVRDGLVAHIQAGARPPPPLPPRAGAPPGARRPRPAAASSRMRGGTAWWRISGRPNAASASRAPAPCNPPVRP